MKVVELKIIQVYQNIYFENEIKILKGVTDHKMLERIGSLNPFIDSCRILRVGGRLEKSTLDESVTHPFIQPKSGKVTEERWKGGISRKLHTVGETSLLMKLDPLDAG